MPLLPSNKSIPLINFLEWGNYNFLIHAPIAIAMLRKIEAAMIALVLDVFFIM